MGPVCQDAGVLPLVRIRPGGNGGNTSGERPSMLAPPPQPPAALYVECSLAFDGLEDTPLDAAAAAVLAALVRGSAPVERDSPQDASRGPPAAPPSFLGFVGTALPAMGSDSKFPRCDASPSAAGLNCAEPAVGGDLPHTVLAARRALALAPVPALVAGRAARSGAGPMNCNCRAAASD